LSDRLLRGFSVSGQTGIRRDWSLLPALQNLGAKIAIDIHLGYQPV